MTGIKGLPKIGDEVDIPTSTYDVPGVVEEIDYNYEVVCGIDDFGVFIPEIRGYTTTIGFLFNHLFRCFWNKRID